jgi:dienelactone hydrolase
MTWDNPPFVLDPPADGVAYERLPDFDTYRMPTGEPQPAVIFVPGPVPADAEMRPRDWHVYQGYGRLTADLGVVAVISALPYHGVADVPTATEHLTKVVDQVRARPDVDPERIAIWAFSGGGLLIGQWLAESPSWLRCLALSYPALRPDPVRPGRPIIVTRVGREREVLQTAVDDFLARATDSGTDVAVVDVPDGQHGFDALDHTDQSRKAVREAMAAVITHLVI